MFFFSLQEDRGTFCADCFPEWVNIHRIGESTFAYHGGWNHDYNIQIRKFLRLENSYLPRANGISFSLKDFKDLMSLKDIITNAFAYADGIPEINLDEYRPNLNVHASINCNYPNNKYLKLWYGNQENLAFKLSKDEWENLKELSDYLMYEMLYFNFKEVDFRSAFEALVTPAFSESHAQVWLLCKEKLCKVIKEYFLNTCPIETEAIEMTFFVSLALEIDIHSIVRRFLDVLENPEIVPIDFLDSINLGDIIQEVSEELCDIRYY